MLMMFVDADDYQRLQW